MDIKSYYESDSGTWTYLLSDPATGAAAIIDPVWQYDPVSGRASMDFMRQALNDAKKESLEIQWILETHAHADHLTAADQLRGMTGARIACGQGICSVQENFSRVFNMMEMPIDGSQFDRLLEDGDEIVLGQLTIRAMATPGHTNDSMTYLAEDAAFIGDTLFAPGFGTARCDFPGGNASQLYDSISAIYALPDNTRLFLCHDYPGDGADPVSCVPLSEMRAANIHLNHDTTRESFVAMRESRDAQLGLPRLILPSLQVNILAGALPPASENGVHYLLTPVNRDIPDLIDPGRNSHEGEKP